MSVEKLLLIILFIAVSYYPLCAIVGFISFIKRNKADKESEDNQMADIELVVKISQEIYNNLKIGCTQRISDGEMIEALKNGTPLNEVLDNIRAEIDKLPSYVARFNGGDYAIHIDKEKVLQIIDKYRGEEDETDN